jgi:hypothetical protein
MKKEFHMSDLGAL